jgi:hypothetical protein
MSPRFRQTKAPSHRRLRAFSFDPSLDTQLDTAVINQVCLEVPWEDLDPDLRRTYGGPESGVGAWYEWDGNRKAGKGRMEITDVDESTVTIDLRFLRPFKSQSTTAFRLEPDGDGTLVTWTMTGPNTFMMKVMGIFTSMEKMIGPDFEKGLDRLKREVETASGTT